ncbi:drebrin-like protein A isoform X2 [Melanotaenia boesemani]|uniref:drebrin-like protein A isoform X2 n=1 Tax=Melanotaenia boesemani TaxID=1250792 RepID=UPI001C04031D|nr:drebrin-like protein A isoform X2 [Melanotaenia boesemani]
MSRPTVNLDTYSLSLLTAKEDILNPRSSTNWALFTYEGVSNKLKLADSGAGGVAELAGKFHISKPQYGLCKVENAEAGPPRIAMISWVGENVDDYRRTECVNHIPAIKNFFKEAHAFITAEKVEDVTEEKIKAELSKAQTHTPTQWVRRSSRSADKEEIVGTNYRKTNAAMEMRLINRDSFWARAEREEEERKEEERRRAAEERRRLERERILKERRDAEERDRKMNEKLQMIEEQRRKQAEQEEELRKKEKFKWEQQQREHEDDMRARLRRSESIEKAAEAAALVSQRPMNPREFFRQLSSSSSQSPTSPGSSRTGKPFRRYQRSLTDTAFIFSKAEESAASSPHSSPLVSPFSWVPPSPIYRSMSPLKSPDFCSVNSPQRARAPVTPPTSPLNPAPPVSALPSFPQTNDQDQPKAPSPTEPSAPPASPSLLVSLSPILKKDNPSQLHSEAIPISPPVVPNQSEDPALNFEPGVPSQIPTAPPPESPPLYTDLNTANFVNSELVSDTGYKVQAVLVEEEEEEDMEEHDEENVKEHEEDEPEMQPELCAVTTKPSQTETEELEEEEQEEEKKEEEQENEDKKEKVGELPEETELTSLEEPVEMMQVKEEEDEDAEENNQSEDTKPLVEPAVFSEKEEESEVTDLEAICQDIKHDTVTLPTNGIINRDITEEQNGTVRSLSPFNTDCSTSDLNVCYSLYTTAEEDSNMEDKEQEISENGQEDLPEKHMCVRALYDYQAEDDSEISFEPGDIIRDVETVDKAWWRGWSKDGRQGLFPANYVETI